MAPSIALTVSFSVHRLVMRYMTSPSGREWMWNGSKVDAMTCDESELDEGAGWIEMSVRSLSRRSCAMEEA